MKLGSAIAAVALAGLSLAAGAAKADLFDFTFVSTISDANTPGIVDGDQVTVHLFADNGGSSDLSQVWNYADLQGFTLAAGTYSATYSKIFPVPTTGNFSTDALGNVTSAQFFGTDFSSNNVDNFGSWTADTVFGNAQFNDFLGNANNITGNTFTDTSEWTVAAAGAAVPEPATWAMMLVGFMGLGAALRARKGLALSRA